MKIRFPIRRCLPSLLACAWLGTAPALRADVPNTVTITARGAEASASRELPQGLGFVVEAEGFVLTTYENVRDPGSNRILGDLRAHVWEEGRSFDATLIGVEPTLNLAVLKLDSDEPLRPSRILRELDLAVGYEIRAPTRLYDSDFGIAEGRLSGLSTNECYQESVTGTMFRATMRIPDAVAGAPVYGADGSVVALHTAYHPPSGDGHAEDVDEVHLLPVFVAFNVYESIKNKGSMLSPWTGFSVRSLTEAEARIFPIPTGHRGGIAIEYIWEGSPAERMGVRAGDFLVQISHNPIVSVADFQKWLYLYGVGEAVKLIFVREGIQFLVADYVIEERPGWARPR